VSLKPCPFCGSEKVSAGFIQDMAWCAGCENTECMAEIAFQDSEEAAIAAWNRRSSIQGPGELTLALDLAKVAHNYHPGIRHDIGLILEKAVARHVMFVCPNAGEKTDEDGDVVCKNNGLGCYYAKRHNHADGCGNENGGVWYPGCPTCVEVKP